MTSMLSSETMQSMQPIFKTNKHTASSVDIKNIVTIVLGGGQGSRLFPLTASCSKPAIPYAGRYHLIDIPISNAINSGCQKIYIITQFLSRSLHQHIMSTYSSGSLFPGLIEILSVEEKHNSKNWLQGTADAVRQNLECLKETHAEYFLILSGDQLYTMDFKNMLNFAQETGADVVVASLPVAELETSRMGILQVDSNYQITKFIEKPQSKEALKGMALPKTPLKKTKLYLGSMGIYLFKRDALFTLLQQDSSEDFGKHIIPKKVAKGNIAAYIHHGYWEDIGTIGSFYRANMAFNSAHPPLNCYDERWRFITRQIGLPGARLLHSLIDQTIVCEGSLIEGATIIKSIIGPRTYIKQGTSISDSYLIGNDFLVPPSIDSALPKKFEIGENCLIERAIIDKHVQIGNHVRLTNRQQHSHYDSEYVYVRDGIIVVPRGVSIPDGFSF